MNNEEFEKDPKGLKCIVLKFDINKLKTMANLMEFFEITGMEPYLKNKTIHDFRQTFMNKTAGEKILSYWLKNWRKCKDTRGYRKQYAQSSISFNWMNYAPIYKDDIPEDEIHIYPKKKGEPIPNLDKWKEYIKEEE